MARQAGTRTGYVSTAAAAVLCVTAKATVVGAPGSEELARPGARWRNQLRAQLPRQATSGVQGRRHEDRVVDGVGACAHNPHATQPAVSTVGVCAPRAAETCTRVHAHVWPGQRRRTKVGSEGKRLLGTRARGVAWPGLGQGSPDRVLATQHHDEGGARGKVGRRRGGGHGRRQALRASDVQRDVLTQPHEAALHDREPGAGPQLQQLQLRPSKHKRQQVSQRRCGQQSRHP